MLPHSHGIWIYSWEKAQGALADFDVVGLWPNRKCMNLTLGETLRSTAESYNDHLAIWSHSGKVETLLSKQKYSLVTILNCTALAFRGIG